MKIILIVFCFFSFSKNIFSEYDMYKYRDFAIAEHRNCLCKNFTFNSSVEWDIFPCMNHEGLVILTYNKGGGARLLLVTKKTYVH